MAQRDGMPRRALTFLHSASGDGYNDLTPLSAIRRGPRAVTGENPLRRGCARSSAKSTRFSPAPVRQAPDLRLRKGAFADMPGTADVRSNSFAGKILIGY